MNGNLYARLESAGGEGTAVAIDAGERGVWTYDALFAATAKFANALWALGVRPGDRVAVQVEKSPEALILCLAVFRMGAVYLPLNTAYTTTELAYFLGDAEPRLLVCRPEAADELSAIADAAGVGALATLGTAGEGTLADSAAGAPESFETVARAPDDLAALLYTSGTTGRSKGAMLSHDNLGSNAATLVDYWRFDARDVLLHALPLYHTHGLFTASLTLLLAGGSMLFLSRFDIDEVIRLLPRATAMMGVPTFYTRLLGDRRLSRALVSKMRLFISGSAPLLEETHRAFAERTGHAILERYGMTETGMNTSNPYDGERRPGTVGFPLPGIALRIVEPESGRRLDAGEIGVIEVKGPNVFRGYWRNPEKTREEFRADGFFITGDLGLIDEDGYVQIVGRGKDLVISGGFNVYPREVESEIDALDGVVESAVIGVPHPDFGEGVAAVVVRAPDADLTEKDVIAGVAGRLAKFKHPKRVFFVDALPRNTMGKVQKNVLRDAYKGAFEAEPDRGD